MASSFNITRSDTAEALIVQVQGEVDIHTSPALESALQEAVNDGKSAVWVDLSDVSFMDSSGLGALIASLRVAKANSKELVLVSPQPAVNRVLAMTGLDKVFSIRAASDGAAGQVDPPGGAS